MKNLMMSSGSKVVFGSTKPSPSRLLCAAPQQEIPTEPPPRPRTAAQIQAAAQDEAEPSERVEGAKLPGTDSQPSAEGQNQSFGPDGPKDVGPVRGQAKSADLSHEPKPDEQEEPASKEGKSDSQPSQPEPKKAKKPRPPREKTERVRAPVSRRAKVILGDCNSAARAALVGLALEQLLRQFDPRLLLQAGEELRAARIPLNVLLTKFVRSPQTVEDIELRGRIESVLSIIERLGGSL